MSGSPSEAEVQAQWRNAVKVLEAIRNLADGTIAGAAGLFDTLIQSLEGEYTPSGLTSFAAQMRAGLSGLLDSDRARAAIVPCLYEYGRLIEAGSYTDPADLLRAIYDHFVANSLSVESRAITYDTTATPGASNIGNGGMSRLTVDHNGFNLEACHVETKLFRCVSDQNSGADLNGEQFEVLGDPISADSLLLASFGSGAGRSIYSKHAGSGPAGSLLRNSSFDTYSATGTPKFAGWTETAGGASITQDTTNTYRTNPQATTDGALKITGGAGTVTLTQGLDQIRSRRIDPNTPYAMRVMLNKTIGSASGGTVTMRMGASVYSVTIAALGSGWQELVVQFNSGCWPRQFQDGSEFAIEIEWSSSTSGYLLVDDVIFCPWDLIDGTYWFLRGNDPTPAAWQVDDTLEFTDTGGAPTTAKLQWWLWVAGLGYLPSTTGTPTFTEP